MVQVDELSITFKALTHPIRREILDILKIGPKTTGELSDAFDDISRYAVMKHLTILEEANLVLVKREGRQRQNFLNAIALQKIVDRWVSKYQSGLASSLLALKSNLERGTKPMNNENQFKHDTFQIEQELRIEAPIDKVFASLTEDINSWWAYRLCGEESALSLEAEVGGRFIEKAATGHGALWGTVTYINAPHEIRLNGLLGMTGAVNSAYSYKIQEDGDHTILSLSHHASGLLDPNWHTAHDEGWKELLGKFLKNYVENGYKYDEQQGN